TPEAHSAELIRFPEQAYLRRRIGPDADGRHPRQQDQRSGRARHQPGRVPGYRKADERVPQRARVEGAYVLLGREVLPGDRHGTQPARQVHRQRLAAREAEAGAVPGEAGERKPLVGGFWTEPPREGYNRSGGFFALASGWGSSIGRAGVL